MHLTLDIRRRLAVLPEICAISLAASLPWSTSATGIFAMFWLLAFIPTCDFASLRRIISTLAGGLPLLLVAFGAIGVVWADVAWADRVNGISSFLKLLFIPALMCQFMHIGRAHYVLIGFLASCIVLLLASWSIFIWPDLPLPIRPKANGILVKDYISQGSMFTVCAAIAVFLAIDAWRTSRRTFAIALSLLGMLFLANVFYVAASRTALLTIPILFVFFGYRQLGWKGSIAWILGFMLMVAAAWPSASFLKERLITFVQEVQSFHPDGAPTPAGERLVFWTKSVEFIRTAPFFGHGTGSIRDQFERSTIGRAGMAAEVSTNPHNQVLGVGIQLGFAGIILLMAMWISHLALFRATDFASCVGLLIVVQNVIGSQFNSHLFDFTHGWAYVVGVGVAGGVILKRQEHLSS